MPENQVTKSVRRVSLGRAFIALTVGEIVGMFTLLSFLILSNKYYFPKASLFSGLDIEIFGIIGVVSIITVFTLGILAWFICAKFGWISWWSSALAGLLTAAFSALILKEIFQFFYVLVFVGAVAGAVVGYVTWYVAYKLRIG